MRAARASVLALGPGAFSDPGGIGAVARRADQRLGHADAIADGSPPLRIASVIPILRDQVAVVRDATQRGRDLGDVVGDTGTALQRQVDVGTGGSANRLALVEVLATASADAAGRVESMEPLPRRRFAHPALKLVRTTVADEQADATVKLRDAAVQAESLRALLRGPRRILVLAGTNAEMLSGGGLVGSIAFAEVRDGAVSLGEFTQSSELVLRKQGPVPLSKQQEILHATMGFGYDLRGITAPSDFQQAGPVAAAMVERAGLGKVDGAVYLDVIGLQRLVGVTGPVQVDDLTIDAENAGDQLLYRNYLRFTAVTRDQRAELQSRVGQAVFKALEERPTDLGKLFDALKWSVGSRHLMGWSADPAEQLLWDRAGASGRLHTEGLQVTLINRSANKLDYHLKPQVVVRTRRAPGDERRVRIEVSVPNVPRDPTSRVVEGNSTRHYNDLMVYLPQNAADIQTDKGFNRSGEEGGMRVVAIPLYLERGTTTSVGVEFTIPKDQPIRLIPSARASPIPFILGKKVVTDELPRDLPL